MSDASGAAPLRSPMEVIPHRPPFLLLDEVTRLDPGRGGAGRWVLAPELEVFAGHFPGRPTLPGVLMVEAMAQLGAYVVLSDERYADRLPLFGGIDRARFRRQAGPGDLLHLEIEIGRLSARAGRGHGRVVVGGETACEADLLFVLVDGAATA